MYAYRSAGPRAPYTSFRVAVVLVLGIVMTTGCAVHRQIQYFAATDSETGATNYYRMTIEGSGGGGVDYHMQAGYFSAAAVDVLRGLIPNIPILDLPVEQIEQFDALVDRFYARLLQEARKLNSVTDPDVRMTTSSDEDIKELARLIWFASLSKSELAAIGMIENVDPFQFRKLVFWTTANNIDLQAYANEIDAVIDNVVAIAEASKARAAARKAERQARRSSLQSLFNAVITDPNQKAEVNAVIDILFPVNGDSGGDP